MDLKKFTEICKDDVNQFEKEWILNKKKNPEYFPDELSEGEWFDQFLTFLTSKIETGN